MIRKILLTLVALVVTFIPFEVGYYVYSQMDAYTFWERLALMSVSVYFLGSIQVFLLVIGVISLYYIWKSKI